LLQQFIVHSRFAPHLHLRHSSLRLHASTPLRPNQLQHVAITNSTLKTTTLFQRVGLTAVSVLSKQMEIGNAVNTLRLERVQRLTDKRAGRLGTALPPSGNHKGIVTAGPARLGTALPSHGGSFKAPPGTTSAPSKGTLPALAITNGNNTLQTSGHHHHKGSTAAGQSGGSTSSEAK
jgi:hypothetical protein